MTGDLDGTPEEVLRTDADSRYRRLMENSRVGMSLNTPDGRFVDVNSALCDMLGYDAATLCTKTWQELTAPTTLEADIRRTNDLAAGVIDNYRTTKQFIHSAGHFIWADLSASCIRDAQGQLELFVAQFTDISDEVAAREELAERQEQNRILAERLQAEMRSAAEYVESILPGDLHGPVEVSSRYLPSLDLGGDGFHYRWLDDDHLKVYVIDVSGHGIRSALLSVSVHNLIRSGSLPITTLLNPQRVLESLNNSFPMEDQGGAYFTIWYGIYQNSTRTLRYASAGHPPALLLTRDGSEVNTTTLSTPGKPIGMFSDSTFESGTREIPARAQVLLYSDGAFELSAGAERGNPQQLQSFIAMCAETASCPDWRLDDLLARLRAMTADGTFDDDCALVLMTFP